MELQTDSNYMASAGLKGETNPTTKVQLNV